MHFSCQLTGLVLAVLWLFQTPLYAAIYKWKDDQGKLHFTDSKSKIPLKYREKTQKLKGVVEPSSKSQPSPSAGGGGSSGAGETEAKVEEAGGESAGSAEKAPAKSKYTKKQLALLKKVKQYMVKAWASNVKLVNNIKPTKLNGKYYIASQRKAASKTKGMIKQIRGAGIPSLLEVKKFLKQSSAKNARLDMGDPPFMEKVKQIRQTIEAEIPVQKELIEKLTKDIGAEEKPPVDDPDAFIPSKPIKMAPK